MMTRDKHESALLDDALLTDIEALAVELAQLGGTEIRAALGGMLRVRYKSSEEDSAHFRDPVSEVDAHVETVIRERLAVHFPDHDIIGEEMDHRPGRGHDFLWAVDPIDGTTNFINGFPLFASSVGVLFRGRPIAGAVWCSTSHALEAGVYHAAVNGPLRFNGATLDSQVNPDVRRRLRGVPSAPSRPAPDWDSRKTGSAAIECAFVAAGLLEMAWFERPNIWDVAAGAALGIAAGKTMLEKQGGDAWQPFNGFQSGDREPGLWAAPMAIGSPEAVERFLRDPAG
ncbi:putative inositol-1-monophosphatase [Sphingobium sp. SYK-6]|uniref:inositol monophosphatase family protein n=1 Tax=Sphingobium sp. (strain NBRC 103272 / SYK-6) TaxID=627192 RepID=UPI0002276CFE|nr:inositol monophosphatase [Sphingobium sp. SYK-6]BAK65588.1 putative inositol-1-monophosphatase [Sphingobium sp. SYK-6]